MELKQWHGFCLCPLGGACPPDAAPADAPFSPLVFLVRRDPLRSRGLFAVTVLDEVFEAETAGVLLPPVQRLTPAEPLREFVAANGACVLNTAFSAAFSVLERWHRKRTQPLRVTLVGLGDVGGTLLLALKLLGRELGELRIYDPNAAQCRRYELELNQVLPLDHPLPPVTVCTEDTLFDCDLLLFTASRGVPPVGSGVADVRLAQYEKNRAMLRSYAAMAREAHFTGLFCQISDPVDPLACAVFRESNRNAAGEFDGCGLLPEQVQGFGLGVMAARARWCAQEDGIDFSNGRVYGPHGGGLVAANDPAAYDKAVSARLTERTVHANLEVRALGFKPYLAPALSSAAVSILSLVRGQPYYAALPLGGVWLGAQRRMTPLGPLQRREPLHPALLARIEAVLRRSGIEPEKSRRRLEFDKLVIDMDAFELTVDGKKVPTPPKEMELLYHLASTPNRVYTRNQLLDEVWGFDYFGDTRTVDVHIKRLREKLEGVSDQWDLKTVWSVGYKFEVK